jgi:hypothetical protein
VGGCGDTEEGDSELSIKICYKRASSSALIKSGSVMAFCNFGNAFLQ